MFAGRFSSSLGAIGVEIGSRAVRLLQVREQAGGLKVIGAARLDAPRSAGPGAGWSPTATQWGSAIGAGGFSGRRCVISLPREDVLVQSVRLPVMPDDDLRQAVAWEASHRFGLDRESMEVDYIPTGTAQHGGESRLELLLVSAPHDRIEQRLEPLLAAGLRPQSIETGFTALARAVSMQHRRRQDVASVRAVVEVGETGSSIMVLRGGEIAFHKPVPIGGAGLNQAVVEHLQVDWRSAAGLREARIAAAVGEGPPGDASLDAAADRAVYEAVRPLLNDLVKEVVLCLRYYGVTFRGQPPEHILLLGANGPEPRLDKLLAQGCKCPVVFDDGRATLEALRPGIRSVIHRAPGPVTGWATAAGLSLRAIGARRSAPRPGDAVIGRRNAA